MTSAFQLAEPKHLDELVQLYDNLNDHLAATTNYPGWVKGIYPEKQTAIDGINEKALYIACCDGKIAATVILRHKPEEAYREVEWGIADDYEHIVVIYTFAVHPNWLGQGIGQELLERVIRECRTNGTKALRLDVYEHNIPAIKLYEKCGFQYIGTVDLGYSAYGLDNFKLYELIL